MIKGSSSFLIFVSMNKSKKEIRAEIRARRSEGSQWQKIWEQLESLPDFAAARTILLYSSIDGEVPTRDFIERWSMAKTIVLPKVAGDILILKQYASDHLQQGYRSIMEPTDEAPELSPDKVDLAIIPGMAFDKQGHRLGRGKGYYDRLLPSMSCPKVAVAFDYQLLDYVPTEEHDVLMDIVITPSNLYLCSLEK